MPRQFDEIQLEITIKGPMVADLLQLLERSKIQVVPREFNRTVSAPQSAPAESGPLLVSVPKAASILGVSKSTLWSLLREGKIKPIRIGRRVLISVQEIKNLLERSAGQD